MPPRQRCLGLRIYSSNFEPPNAILYGTSAGKIRANAHQSHASSISPLPDALRKIVYDYAPLCDCKCNFAEDNLLNRSYLQTCVGCDVVACSNHLACTCCYRKCPLDFCEDKTCCAICAIACSSCVTQICHRTCSNE